MSGKPSDVLEQLDQLANCFTAGGLKPAWYDGAAPTLRCVLLDAKNEIKKNRQEMAELIIMKESYGRLYQQIYGND